MMVSFPCTHRMSPMLTACPRAINEDNMTAKSNAVFFIAKRIKISLVWLCKSLQKYEKKANNQFFLSGNCNLCENSYVCSAMLFSCLFCYEKGNICFN